MLNRTLCCIPSSGSVFSQPFDYSTQQLSLWLSLCFISDLFPPCCSFDKEQIHVITILTSLTHCVKPTLQRTGDRSFYAGWVCGTSQAQKVWSLLPPAPPAWRISGPSTKQTVQWSYSGRHCEAPNRGQDRRLPFLSTAKCSH